MAYPPPPGTNSLPARPPVSAHARPGFKPGFNSISQPSTPSYASAPPPRAHASGPTTYPPATTQQYGSSSYSAPYGGRAATAAAAAAAAAPPASLNGHHHAAPPSYQYPQQRQGYGAHQSQHHSNQYHNHHNHHHHQQPQVPHLPHLPHQQHGQHGQHSQHSQHQGYAQTAQYSATPQIRNPFPTPGPGAAGGGDPSYDPEMAAQIAQWQSAYTPRDTDKDGRPAPAIEYPKPADVPDPLSAQQPERKKTVVREGGGKKWKDDTLLEWDPSHLRLFVGNLAGETTDESLLKAFSRWRSVQKARVIRDRRTTKSKGFGFVSFSDADDFFQAAKEMNGKYIQSHPVVVKKATTEIKVTNAKDKSRHGGKKGGGSNKGNNQNQGDKKKGWDQGGGYEPYLGPMAGGGVTKPGQKTKNGLRLLG